MQRYIQRFTMGIVAMFCLAGCSYKFSGASIPPDMKTVNVQFFENTSALVVPRLSNDFTEALKKRIRDQTRLGVITGDADAIFEGRITNYAINPVAIQDNTRPTAGASRLSITVSVKYTNKLDPKKNFEQSFERFKDFQLAGQSIQALEQQLINDVNMMLTEDIFNRAFSQW